MKPFVIFSIFTVTVFLMLLPFPGIPADIGIGVWLYIYWFKVPASIKRRFLRKTNNED